MLTADAVRAANPRLRHLLRVALLVAIFFGTPLLLAELLDIQRGAGAYPPACREPWGFWVLFERCDGEDHDALIHAFLTAMAGALAVIMTSFERTATRTKTLLRTSSLAAIGVGAAAALMGLIGLTTLLERWVATVAFGGAIVAAIGGLGLSRYRDTSLLPAVSVFVLFFNGVLMWALLWDLPS